MPLNAILRSFGFQAGADGSTSAYILPEDAWTKRHNAVLFALLAMLVGILVAGFQLQVPYESMAAVIPCTILFVILAASERVARNYRTLLASTGLLTSVVALITFTDGALQTHLLFPVALAAIALYHDKLAWVTGVLYVSFFYFFVAWTSPALVFPPGLPTVEVERWSVALWFVSVLIAVIALIDWQLSASVYTESTALSSALSFASIQQRQATELHDTVVQELVTARYALMAEDQEAADASIGKALDHAQRMVDGLLLINGVDISSALLRDTPSQEEDPAEDSLPQLAASRLPDPSTLLGGPR